MPPTVAELLRALPEETEGPETLRESPAEWSLPMPVLARLLVTVVDGLSLNWLADRDSEANRATPPRQVDAGGRLMLNLSSQILPHPVLLPSMVLFSTRLA